MTLRCRLSLFALFLAGVFSSSTAHADLIYHLKFEDAKGEKSLAVVNGSGQPFAKANSSGVMVETGVESSKPWACDLSQANAGATVPAIHIDQSHGKFDMAKLGDKLTVAAWISFQGYDSHPDPRQGIVNNGMTTDGASGWTFGVYQTGKGGRADDTSPAQLYFQVGPATRKNTDKVIALKTWTHVAVTWTTGEDPQFFLNGQPQNIAAGIGNFKGLLSEPTEGDIRIGLVNMQFLPGNLLIDDVRIYNEILSAEQLAKIAAPQ